MILSAINKHIFFYIYDIFTIILYGTQDAHLPPHFLLPQTQKCNYICGLKYFQIHVALCCTQKYISIFYPCAYFCHEIFMSRTAQDKDKPHMLFHELHYSNAYFLSLKITFLEKQSLFFPFYLYHYLYTVSPAQQLT